MKVPLLDIQKQNLSLLSKLEEAATSVIRSGQFINGPAVQEFEESCQRILGVKHAIGVSSGTDALLVVLMALGIGPGDEVICPSFTFFATAGAIARLGATPVFVDIEKDSFNIDHTKIEALITDKTKAILPVHLFGRTSKAKHIKKIAKAHGLFMIEDCAQSFGSQTFDGSVGGTIGDAGCFSFFPSKNLGGFGDAGLVSCEDDSLAAKIRSLRNHGSQVRYYHNEVGGNFRMDTLQAALLNVKLEKLEDDETSRLHNAIFYSDALKDLLGITLPEILNDRQHVYNQYTLLIADGKRDAFQKRLTEEGIGNCIYYPVPLHKQVCFLNLKPSLLPVTDEVVEQCLSIPIGPELTSPQIVYVAQTIRKIHAELFV